MKPIICSGPVIIENGKILLVKEQKENHITRWLFPGGKADPNESIEETCRREVKEEVGIEIEIIKPLKTIQRTENDKNWTLHHFLAKRIGEIKPGDDIVEYAWLDINNLPEDCSPNVYEIVKNL